MRSGRSWRFWGFGGVLAAALGLSAGCAADGTRLERALMSNRDPAAHSGDLEEHYAVHCPDLLELEAAGRPDCGGAHQIGADGRISLPDGGRLHVDGLTTAEISQAAAARLQLSPDQVQVQVVGYDSQQIYLFGAVAGRERCMPYQGPETVVDLLQRVGGVSAGAAVGDVQVVRSHVADGSSPELFHVDLEAILLRHDQRTNIRLQPFDEVYVGELRRSSFKCCVPPWLRPLYERACGLRQGKTPATDSQNP
ncbi:MAG TPA: polysaccharide biosynthesis/export family protein [Gemmataceae bacterium]|nr:polysaccharide biosynthesis/export family protein [Gemmataceae bacterium]